MKSYKHDQYKKNRNRLGNLIRNPFKEPLSLTIDKTISKRSFIKNKRTNISSNGIKLLYELRIANHTGFVYAHISEDHLITIKVTYIKTKEIKTRSVSEVVLLLEEILFT